MGTRLVFVCLVLLMLVLAQAGCQNGAIQPEGLLPPEPGPAADSRPLADDELLPLPSELRLSSYVSSDSFLFAASYRLDLPGPHTSVFGSTSLFFNPDYNRAPGSEPAFAFYTFDISTITHDGTVHLDWATTRDYADAWVGVANFDENRWDWRDLTASNYIGFDDPTHSDAGLLTVVVLITGQDGWVLDDIWVGPVAPPIIEGVTPVSGHNNEAVSFNAVMHPAAGAVSSWAWDFDTAADPGTSTVSSPAVSLKDPGIHQCSVTATNPAGEATLEFDVCIRHSSETWNIQAVAGGFGNMTDTSLCLESGGAELPHIGFAYADQLMYTWHDGNTWHVTPIASETYEVTFTNTSMVLNAASEPIVVFTSWSSSAECLYQTGGAWLRNTIEAKSAPGMGFRYLNPRIAIDSTGVAHVSYERTDTGDDWNSDNVMHATFDGTDWSDSVVLAYSGGLMDFGTIEPMVPLCLSSTNEAYVAYYDDGPRYLQCEMHPGSLADDLIDNSHSVPVISIDIDSSDNPQVVYDVDSGPLYYARYTGSEWLAEPIAGTDSALDFISFKLDSSDNPHIAYRDAMDDDLRMVYYDSGWTNVLVDGFADVGRCCSLQLDASDVARISYYDATNDYIKYAVEPSP